MLIRYKLNTTDNIWVYSQSNVNSERIKVLTPQSIIEVTETNGDWYKYSGGWVLNNYNGKAIFIQADNITITPIDIKANTSVKIKQSASVYANSGATIPDFVKAKTHIVYSIDGDKALLGFPDGIRSWVYINDLSVDGDSYNGVSNTVTPSQGIIKPVSNKLDSINAAGILSTNDTGITTTSTPSSVYASADDVLNATDSTFENYKALLNGLRIKTLRGVHGMPYQWMEIADRRIDSTPGSFGRKYAEKIVARMPLLILTPGTPEFLSSYSDSEKKGFIQYIVSDKSSNSDLDQILKREGKYYSLKPNWTAYYNYVNPMLSAAARFLGLNNIKMDGYYLDKYPWEKMNNEEIHRHLCYRGSLAFYINSEHQISDTISNNTSESMLASKVNGMSDLGREMNFLLGGASASTGMAFDKASQENLLKNLQNSEDFASKMINGSDIIKGIVGGLQTVFSGGKLIFPELWSDSSFSRSYDVNLKLTTPDCDKLSWFLNICVPLLHLVGLVAPRQAGVNGYVAPFLVRGFYKGLFNCDMGIITNMNINKGQEGAWTKDGLPTVLDVSFSIKDLYSALSISSNQNIKNGLMNNIILLDFIANTCGVNINEPDLIRTIDMYFTQNVENKITNFVRLDVAGGLDQWATNKIMSLYKR